MSNSTERNPLEPSKSVKTGEDIWQAIASILEVQNQAPALVPVSRNEDLPLSFSQERLWFLYQLQSDSSTYNVSFAFRLQGLLNITALENSLNEIIQRHETLRTTFVVAENTRVQAIAPSFKLTLPIVDFKNFLRKKEKLKFYNWSKKKFNNPSI